MNVTLTNDVKVAGQASLDAMRSSKNRLRSDWELVNLVPRVSLSPPPRALGGGERETLGTRLGTCLQSDHI